MTSTYTVASPEASSSSNTNNNLTPFSSSHRSNTGSPNLTAHTPADSLSVQYQSSDFGDVGDGDPFFGADFNNFGGTPSFLDEVEQAFQQQQTESSLFQASYETEPSNFQPSFIKDESRAPTYPLSPDKTPSLNHPSPESAKKSRPVYVDNLPQSISPTQLHKTPPPAPCSVQTGHVHPQLTPDTFDNSSGGSRSGRSSEDGLAPAHVAMQGTSPRVTVSDWGRDGQASAAREVATTTTTDPTTPRALHSDTLFSSTVPDALGLSAPRDARWTSNERRGLDPEHRPATEATSINELAGQREADEKHEEVDRWIAKLAKLAVGGPDEPRTHPIDGDDNIPVKEIDSHDMTENKYIHGQIYFKTGGGGEITQTDLDLMAQSRVWNDAPVVHAIRTNPQERQQPETSQAAIEKYERMMRDTESVLSRAATWGTRRRSLPSIYDSEGTVGGNFLKKLSVSKDNQRPNPLGLLRGLMRKGSSQNLKRKGSSPDRAAFHEDETSAGQNSLAPPPRTPSWNKQKPTPSINTALVNMGSKVAAVGAAHHARTGSVSAVGGTVVSPKSPFANTLGIKTLRRPRSRSEMVKKEPSDQSALADMWKKEMGGPPVPPLSKQPTSAVEVDDDDDDDDDFYEDNDMKEASSKMIDDITPTFSGFQQHILKLNPMLAETNTYLVDRIAHQQIVRYKALLNNKVKHLQQVQRRDCVCGSMCMSLNGQAKLLNNHGETRGQDPLSTGSDDDNAPLEGAITAESFPQDIPIPPTAALPAEFECQLCFQAKKFQKPSDWTKHVHEDVQPFTCTWDRCREPKIFKRKADWVRHENEGHRHLEWWTCDVEDCHHTCYRRDNFLQHLVREHKFAEPKHKTKAAIKRAGGNDPTWVRVEKCHAETQRRPQEEPCRFCGKTFPTWKKLTVHLAKHMEQISLPIIRLVNAKDLEPDTIISPVQDPPPRTFNPPTPIKPEQQHSFHAANMAMGPTMNPGFGFQGVNGYNMYPVMPTSEFQQPYYGAGGGQPQFSNINSIVDPVSTAPALHALPGMVNPTPAAYHQHHHQQHHSPLQQQAMAPQPQPQQQQQFHPQQQRHRQSHSHSGLPVVTTTAAPGSFVVQNAPVMVDPYMATVGPALDTFPAVSAPNQVLGHLQMAGLVPDPTAGAGAPGAVGFDAAGFAGPAAGLVDTTSPHLGGSGVVTPNNRGSHSPYQQSPYSQPSHSPHQGNQAPFF